MNSNQSKKLTPKQQELVKRLESIRSNRDTTSEKANKPEKTRSSVSSQGRNRNAQQNQPAPANSSKTRTRTTKQSEFARPVVETSVQDSPKTRAAYKPRYTRVTQSNQQAKQKSKKKTDNYIKQLSDGKKLSRAIILSEILDKPVALRKR